ncbi:MAG TPA: exodeoxyribonuclease VII large subunit [Bdellovibrionota bacterium]|jgi:exodeoxyribonuclease VII large subunit|nr:exodeoxyribonuclease VII large subunit [Bdellovibrionota bacterium]
MAAKKGTPTSKKSRKKASDVEQVGLFSFAETDLGGLGADTQLLAVTKASEPVVVQVAPEPEPEPEVEAPGEIIYSVTDLAHRFRDHLREHFSSIVVQGEIADFKGIHRSGHLYFALKDDSSQIRAVMWKGALNRVPFKIEQGLEVIVRGKLDFYGGSGSTQIVVEHMEPVGIGALQLKFEQLKEKLRAEGLFDATRKRVLPPIAWRIGVVTGKSTAAFQDMQKVLRHRFPLAEVYLFHAAVQGTTAPGEIVSAIRRANAWSERQAKPLDVLIVGRGGGSYEDLFCFNEESVARAIVGSKLPVVTGIGHEIDTTIADFVADYRAATPSHAVSSVVPEILDWQNRLEYLAERMTRRVSDLLADLAQKIDHLQVRLFNAAPHKQLAACRDLLTRMQDRLRLSMLAVLEARQTRVKSLALVLDALSPLKVLDRGYSLVKTSEGTLVRSAAQLSSGDEISVEWAKDKIKARVI